MKGCTGCCNVPPNFVAIANLVLAENICHSPLRHTTKSAEDTSEGAAKISTKSEVRSYGMEVRKKRMLSKRLSVKALQSSWSSVHSKQTVALKVF
jgi:hypothetical protein